LYGVLQLSDQQLLVGLVVLVCTFAKYFWEAVNHGNDNLWHSADIACFSRFSHAATVLALQQHFRENQRLAAIRVSLMIAVFALWMTHYILRGS